MYNDTSVIIIMQTDITVDNMILVHICTKFETLLLFDYIQTHFEEISSLHNEAILCHMKRSCQRMLHFLESAQGFFSGGTIVIDQENISV